MKKDQTKQVLVSEKLGSVSTLLTSPKNPKTILVLAHGAGAGMMHPFMEAIAQGLLAHDVATLRFNFPYMEKKAKRPDPPAIAEKTVEVMLEYAHENFPDCKLFAGGKSFGGRMTSQRISKGCPPYLKGLVFFGFPLHAPGKSSIDRAQHLSGITIPMLYLQGTRDALAEMSLMEKVCSGLTSATLKKFEGADHSFKVSKTVITSELVASTIEWMDNI